MRTLEARNRKAGRKWLSATALVLAALALAGCRQDMHDQPKYKPLAVSDFYADRRSARPIINGTVPRGALDHDEYFYTGKVGNNLGTEFPFPVTEQVLQRGQERYNIFCSPCHSRVGDGNGMIVQRGFKRPPSYHTDRLRQAPVGHFFQVITNGFGAMGEYGSQVPPADRWAIIAYIRALQFSQNATRADVPSGVQVSPNPPNLNVSVVPPMSSQKAQHGEAVAGSEGGAKKK